MQKEALGGALAQSARSHAAARCCWELCWCPYGGIACGLWASKRGSLCRMSKRPKRCLCHTCEDKALPVPNVRGQGAACAKRARTRRCLCPGKHEGLGKLAGW